MCPGRTASSHRTRSASSSAHRAVRPARSAPRAPARGAAPPAPRRAAGLSAGDRVGPRVRLDGGALGARPHRPQGGDHRAGGAQDDDQRAQLRRAGLHGGLRGRTLAALDQRRHRTAQLHGRRAAHARVRSPEERYALGERLATRSCGRAGGIWKRSTSCCGRPVPRAWWTSASTSSTTRASCWPGGAGRISICRSWRAISRRGFGTTCSTRPGRAGPAPRLHPGDGPDRDHPRRLRDGRDPVRAAGPRGRAQRGRWDYLFSIIKNFRDRPEFVLPDRRSSPCPCRSCGPIPSCWCAPATAATPTPSAAWPRSPSRRDAEVNATARRRSGRTRDGRRTPATTAPGWRTRPGARGAGSVRPSSRRAGLTRRSDAGGGAGRAPRAARRRRASGPGSPRRDC